MSYLDPGVWPDPPTWRTRAQGAQCNAAGQVTSWQEQGAFPGGDAFHTLTRSLWN